MKYLLIMTLILALPICALAEEGDDRGNGGDAYSQEFISTARTVVKLLQRFPIKGLDSDGISRLIDRTVVGSKESLLLRGTEVDAINYPDANKPRIEVSRRGWDRMRHDFRRKRIIVLHEFLSIAGIDDSHYQYSELLTDADVCERTPAIRLLLEAQLKKSCTQISSRDLESVTYLDFPAQHLNRLEHGDFAGLVRLRSVSLGNNSFTSLPADLFEGAPSIEGLGMGSFVENLADCSFLRELRYLATISIGSAASPIRNVPAGCLAEANFGMLFLRIDGNDFDPNGLFANFTQEHRQFAVTFQGIGFEKLPVSFLAEQRPALHQINFELYTWRRNDEFLSSVQNATHLTCEPHLGVEIRCE
ncbi:MAG: hypothetical protein AB7K68_11515 [Bacteriovoracia bacterium]